MKVVVATDRSETARQAVSWAADLARSSDGELVLLQVLTGAGRRRTGSARGRRRTRTRARAPARRPGRRRRAIVRAADEEEADVLVVGNAGMGGRKEFLLGNIPNRVSHAATVHRRHRQHDRRRGPAARAGGGRGRRAAPPRGADRAHLRALRARRPRARVDGRTREAAARGARGARADLREARPDPFDAARSRAAGRRRRAREAAGRRRAADRKPRSCT